MSNRGGPRARTSPSAGVTLVELLVALTLVGLALASVGAMAVAVMARFEAEPAAADAQQRMRAGMNALIDDVQRAGSGFIHAPEDGPGVGLPALVPHAPALGPWVMRAVPGVLTTLYGTRSAAHATLRAPSSAGESRLRLDRPPYCHAASPSCGFSRGDDVLVFDRHGRVSLAQVREVVPPLDLEMAAPLAESWRTGASVSAVVVRSYALRRDPATGLAQLVRSRGNGPATAAVDFVTAFDVAWHTDGGRPVVRLSPDGTLEDASTGPRPPASGQTSELAWPPGENCAYAADAAGLPVWRGSTGAAALGTFDDGPWCPSPVAPTRWDVDLSRISRVTVTLGVAVASAQLRPPLNLLRAGRASARLVPDMVVSVDIIPGRRHGGE